MEYDSLFILFNPCAGKWIWFSLLLTWPNWVYVKVVLCIPENCSICFMRLCKLSGRSSKYNADNIIGQRQELNRYKNKFCVYWPLRVVVLEVLVWQHWRHFVHPLWEMRHKMVKLFLPQFLVFYTSPLVSVSARPVNEIRYVFCGHEMATVATIMISCFAHWSNYRIPFIRF